MQNKLPFPHQKEKPLSNFSTLGIGGAARLFALAHTVEEMVAMFSYTHRHSIPTLVIGKGSNCLFDDRGFNGLVILNKIDYLREKEGGVFVAGAGYSFARLGAMTAKKGWTGLEFASGIPATVGGAIYMNAGANGNETCQHLLEVKYVTHCAKVIHLSQQNLSFGYRYSRFQEMKGAVVEGVFQLKHSVQAEQNQKKLLGYRVKTQPYGKKSAGCAFRNPPEVPAGKLIEECGLKGLSVGGATVSDLHANFIVNGGGATARDVLSLMQCIQEHVYSKKGVNLEKEIRYIPYE
jgi:UDP-N-acetylmuramate dehydrogenase